MRKLNFKLIAVILIAMLVSEISNSQTTIVLKPNSTDGKDAMIFTKIGSNEANMNFGNYTENALLTWTWSSQKGSTRSLIRFDQLSNIPSNAIVTNVKLILHGVSSSGISPQGNSYYTGSTFPTNPVVVQQITSNWDENTVTWNNQPTTTTVNQMLIPASTSRWNWDYTINNSTELQTIVQNMVNNPTSNYGFMLKLQTEETYRSMLFASSDHPDSTLWPELIVTYETCDANFAFCGNTLDNNYSFDVYKNFSYYRWTINGNHVASTQGFNYQLQAGINEVCVTTSLNFDTCSQCVTIIIPETQFNNQIFQQKSDINIDNKINYIEPCDIIENDKINIYPNPSKNNWNIKINSSSKEKIKISLLNSIGDVISIQEKNINVGENIIDINGDSLPKGLYFINLKGDNINSIHKLTKE